MVLRSHLHSAMNTIFSVFSLAGPVGQCLSLSTHTFPPSHIHPPLEITPCTLQVEEGRGEREGRRELRNREEGWGK